MSDVEPQLRTCYPLLDTNVVVHEHRGGRFNRGGKHSRGRGNDFGGRPNKFQKTRS